MNVYLLRRTIPEMLTTEATLSASPALLVAAADIGFTVGCVMQSTTYDQFMLISGKTWEEN